MRLPPSWRIVPSFAWGDPSFGGTSAVQSGLKTVLHIEATYETFAAILADGSMVTWAPWGGARDQTAQPDSTASRVKSIVCAAKVPCRSSQDMGGKKVCDP